MDENELPPQPLDPYLFNLLDDPGRTDEAIDYAFGSAFGLSKTRLEPVNMERPLYSSRHFWRGFLEASGQLFVAPNRSSIGYDPRVRFRGHRTVFDAFWWAVTKSWTRLDKPRVDPRADGVVEVLFTGQRAKIIVEVLYYGSAFSRPDWADRVRSIECWSPKSWDPESLDCDGRRPWVPGDPPKTY